MSFGPDPWQQTSWDARAAANFIGGGIGSGVIVYAALSGASGLPLSLLLIVGLVFIAAGLLCVFAEIGRPLRSVNVLIHLRRSWMAREALVAPMLFLAGAVAAYTGNAAHAWPAAALALAFVYCQARILRAAKGIPAWRDPMLTPFILTTSLAEGAGLFWVCAAHHGAGTLPLLTGFGGIVAVRLIAWLVYRRSVAATAAAPALAALDRAGQVLKLGGTLLPLTLVAIVAAGFASSAATLPLAAIAGVAALVSGAWVKATLVLRAGFNQGFTLPHLPVRGVRP
jgi:phenylacetyl-CoA:acceptor oxidoreductase subunit 2